MTTYTLTTGQLHNLMALIYDSVSTNPKWIADRENAAQMLRSLQPNTQEPTHYVDDHGLLYTAERVRFLGIAMGVMQPLYTHPAPQKPLTDKQIESLWDTWLTSKYGAVTKAEALVFARLIEAANGVKPS